MTTRDPNFDAYVLKIYAVLDRLDYYRLLGVEAKARLPEVRSAFYAIANRYHPDRNRDANPEVRAALYDIFKRLNEAYRVLCNAEHRKIYDEGLAEGKVRLDTETRRGAAPKTPEDTIKSREARQFYRQASTDLASGNLMKAELNIKLASAREPGNKAIEELIASIRQAKAAKKP